MLSENVCLKVDGVAGLEGTKVGVGEGGGNEGHFKVIVTYGGDGEGGAVHGDAAFFYHIFSELRWQVETERVPMLADFPVNERGGGIDVALDDMAAEAAGDGEGALQIHRVADMTENTTVEGFFHDVSGEPGGAMVDDGEADAIDCDGVTGMDVGGDSCRGDVELTGVAAGGDGGDGADFFDDSAEHEIVVGLEGGQGA